MAARYTLHFRNGKQVDFESASVKIKTKVDAETGANRISEMEYFRKDNGLSLIYVDYAEIIAVTRDTKGYDE